MTQLFVKNLSVIDFSYFDNRRGILGESWGVDIVLSGQLDEQGMLFDFGHVKKTIKKIIDEQVDHCFVISSQTKNLEIIKNKKQHTVIGHVRMLSIQVCLQPYPQRNVRPSI